jgi:predicted permease
MWRLFIDAGMADAIAGDLEEQRRRRAQRSRVRAELWLWRRSFALAWFFGRTSMGDRLRRTVRGAFAGPGGLGADIRYSLRALRRSPAYTLTVVAVVALGMTLATTVFAVVDGVLFRPLPYPAADRLVAIEPGFTNLPAPAATAANSRPVSSVSPLDLANWRKAAPDIAITAFRAQGWGGLGEGVNEPAYGGALVEANFFDTIGVQPLIGGFTPADFDREDRVRPVIISHELWQTRFRGMPDVIGQRFIGDPTAAVSWGFRVVGVMPPGFLFPSSRLAVSMIGPFVPDRAKLFDPTLRSLPEVIARVPARMSAETLAERLAAGTRATAAAFPVRGPKPANWSERGWAMQGPYDRVNVSPLSSRLGRQERPLFAAIFTAAIILLALGGLNVSGLMTARGLDRARELALRRALGASAAAVARLVFVEAMLPIAIGSIAGLALAVPLLRVGARLLPEELVLLRTQSTVGIDFRVVLFVLGSAAVLATLSAVWPIRRALTPTPALAEGGRGGTRSRSFGRAVIVVSQVAGALVLTLGGGLLVTSILAVYSHRPPIRTDGVVAMGMTMVGPGVTMGKLAPERTPRINAMLEAIRRVPGVTDVGLTDAQTLVGGGEMSWFMPPPQAGNARLVVGTHAVTPHFYRVLDPQLVMGRLPNDAELGSDAPVIVVSERVARAYWPNESPLGQTLIDQQTRTPFAVVGVVRDVRWNSWDTELASIYGPYTRLSRFPFPTVFIQTSMSASQTLALVTPAIAAADPLISVDRAGTLNDFFKDSVRQRRFQSWLFGSFAFAALVIVGSGILGLIAMSTARRTREMGIRLALGSTREGLVRLLLREQLRSVAAGVVIGSAVSIWAVRFVQTYLYEVTPYDLRVWSIAIFVIVATTVIGTLVPSLRASRTDPVDALRTD